VEAGADQAVTLPDPAVLNGSAGTDDLLGDVRIYRRALNTPQEVLLAQAPPQKKSHRLRLSPWATHRLTPVQVSFRRTRCRAPALFTASGIRPISWKVSNLWKPT